MKSSLKIGSIMGIPIKLHITFLLILPMFAYLFAINPQPFGFEGVEPPITRYALSVLTAILLFASILLHELAHSYMARRYGVNIESITLFLFGGVSAMEEMPRKPGQEAKMAFAGPLTSLVIGSICLFIYGNLIFPNPSLSQNPVYFTLWILGAMNLSTRDFQPPACFSNGRRQSAPLLLCEKNVLCESYPECSSRREVFCHSNGNFRNSCRESVVPSNRAFYLRRRI